MRWSSRSVVRALLSVSVAASVCGCMFFRSLDDLSNTVPASDGSVAETSIADAGEPESDAGPARVCSAAQAPAPDGSLALCFDYDDGGPLDLFAGTPATTIRAEDDNGPSPPKALVIRFQPTAPPAFETASQRIFYDFVARSVEISLSVRQVGTTSEFNSLFGVRRDDVSSYVIVDAVRGRLAVTEQDQRDGGQQNGTVHALENFNPTSWQRIHLKFDFEAGTFTLRVDGRAQQLVGVPMAWPKVETEGSVWIGSPYFTNNADPVSMHFDDVIVRVQ